MRAFEDIGATFFDAETDLLIVLDEEGNISRVNPAFERALGRKEINVLHSEMLRLIDENDLARFINSFDATTKAQPVRLLKREKGTITATLIAYRFRRTDEGLRGYLILRPEQNES